MKTVELPTLVARCQAWMTPDRYRDYDRARNGLQVENRGRVRKIAAAVDCTLATVRLAAASGADLMVVHHGLFWSETRPWTGPRMALIRALLEADMAVYAMHLPLDAHPTLGNAALLARQIGLRRLKPFFRHEGESIGWRGELDLDREALGHRLAEVLGRPPILLAGGGQRCRQVGICTGGAGAELQKAAAEGVDTFITGEGPHWTHALAEETGINVFYGGHYATETFGVRALAEKLARQFGLPWEFIDHPSGL
jgi:dinuclear metal center YbgI/SA1388 family protein